jgi:hypothetical protein
VNTYRWSIVVALLFLPLASSAQELNLGVNFESAYDTNVYSTTDFEVDDFSFRIGPDISLEDHEGELQWKLRYRPSYEYFIDSVDARGWTHLAEGKLSWQASPRTRIELSDLFGRFRDLNRFNEVVTTGVGDGIADATAFGFRRDENTRNTFDADLTHRLAPTRMIRLNVGHNLIDFDREGRSDRQTLRALGHYTETVSRRDELGGGVSYRHSTWDASSSRRSQSTDFYNLFGSWRHQFDETLELNLAAGPTWVRGDDRDNIVAFAPNQLLYPLLSVEGQNRLVEATSCPRDKGDLILTADCEVIRQNLNATQERALRSLSTDLELIGPVPSGSSDSLTYFANMSLSKRWEQWSGTIAYRRQQSDSSGLGSSTVADILSGNLEWKPSPRWRTTFRAALTRQTQETEFVQTTIAVMPADLSPLLGSRFRNVAESFALRAVEIDQDVEVWTLWLRLNVRYRLTERTTLYGNVMYWDQNGDGDSGFLRDYERLRVNLGVEYRFDPIRL